MEWPKLALVILSRGFGSISIISQERQQHAEFTKRSSVRTSETLLDFILRDWPDQMSSAIVFSQKPHPPPSRPWKWRGKLVGEVGALSGGGG